jgi:hypothetical protein
LTRERFALVDEEDAATVNLYFWQAIPGRHTYYARRALDEDGSTEALHRFIADRAGLELEHDVDHEDGDGLNNRRNNLRSATKPQNASNRRRRADSTTGYKGVSPHPYSDGRPRYQARIEVEGKRRSLGYFTSPEDAAKAYDRAALELHGAFAFINFPGEPANDNNGGAQ